MNRSKQNKLSQMCRLDLVLLMGAHPNGPLHMPATQNAYFDLVGLLLHNLSQRSFTLGIFTVYMFHTTTVCSVVSRPIGDTSDRLHQSHVAYSFYINTMII